MKIIFTTILVLILIIGTVYYDLGVIEYVVTGIACVYWIYLILGKIIGNKIK